MMIPQTLPHASQTIIEYLAASRATLDGLSVEQIQDVLEELEQAYTHGRQVLIIGNGGSASTASHFACDLAKTILGRPVSQRARRFRVLSLSDNMALITAWANDATFDDVFAEQVRTIGQRGDLLVAITGSGNSPNILAAVDAARDIGMRSVGLLGFDGGRVRDQLDKYILVDSDHYGHVEDAHMMLAHLLTAHFSALVRAGASR
jgi:D-sedoheptulose 7-phosphate isomerase